MPSKEVEALERLKNTLLRQKIASYLDREPGEIAFLHTSGASISVVGNRYKVEHVNFEGDTVRSVTVKLTQPESAARLVASYTESQSSFHRE